MKANKLLVILIIALVLIGVVIVTNILSFSNIQQTIINQIKENQLIETDHAAAEIESHVVQVKDELVTLSKFPLIETIDSSKCSGLNSVHEKIEGKISSLLRVDKEGNVVECSSSTFSNYLGLNIKNKEYFKIPKETNEPAIVAVRDGSNRQIIISVPLFETTEYTPYPNFVGEFKGVLMSIIELNNLYYLYLHKIAETDKMYFILVDLKTQETILKSNELPEYSEIKKFLPSSQELNTIAEFDRQGKTIMTSADLFIGDEKWRLILFTPLKNIESEVKPLQTGHLLSLVFVIIIIVSVFIAMVSLYRSKEKVQMQLEKANVTLEKLGIHIGIETDKYTQADIVLEPKKMYLIKDETENHAHELFIGSLNRGYAGLGLVREDPRVIKQRYNLQKTSFIWLTKAKVEGIPTEANIDNLFDLIEEFVKKSKKSVILIDRLDYLLHENSFEDVMKKIHQVKDLIVMHDALVIISINPKLLDQTKLNVLESETVDLLENHLKKNIDLTDQELGILRLINERNVVNKLASFKDITSQYHITKPTTRVKIAKLQLLGLVQVEQKGRFKALKITSLGRRLLS